MKRIIFAIYIIVLTNLYANSEYSLFLRTETFRRFHVNSGLNIMPNGFYNDSPSMMAVELYKNDKSVSFGYADNSFGAETSFLTINTRKYINKKISIYYGIGVSHGYKSHNEIVYNNDIYIIDIPLVNNEGFGIAYHIGFGYEVYDEIIFDVSTFGTCIIFSISSKIKTWKGEWICL